MGSGFDALTMVGRPLKSFFVKPARFCTGSAVPPPAYPAAITTVLPAT